MIKNIIKRDGRTVPFDEDKIANAIYKAAQAVGGSDKAEAYRVASIAISYLEEKNLEIPSVEGVQNMVEKALIEEGHAKTAKAYILYRADRTRVRDMNTKLMKIYEDITFTEATDSDIKRENANVDGNTIMGLMLKYGSEGAKEFTKKYIMDKRFVDAHESGDIHVHDMDFLSSGSTTCCQVDILRLFADGFSTGHGFLREPNDIRSYSALAAIAIQANQNDQHGGQSIPNFDYGMAPGVAKTFKKLYRANMAKLIDFECDRTNGEDVIAGVGELIERKQGLVPKLKWDKEFADAEAKVLSSVLNDLHVYSHNMLDLIRKMQKKAIKYAIKETEKATYQAMEAFVHNLNTMHSRAGAQVPFSSVNYGTDTSPEGRLVIKQLLLATDAGLGRGETPIFPIQIFKVKEGVSYTEKDPNYDLFKLAMKVSSKRLFPNFSFLDSPFNLQYYKEGHPETEAAYMGCRTRVIGNNYDKEREITYSRGNLSFTSINLPRLGIEAKGDMDLFYKMLDEKLELVIEQLNERFKIQCQKKVKNFPFLMGQGVWLDSKNLKPDDTLEEVLKHGTLTAGFIGLAECLVALTGKHHGESDEAQELGLEIISHMRKRMDEESERTGLNYSLIATPAEGLSGRFVKIDANKYGVLPGITDKDYYTNSFHVPVYSNITAFEKIQKEAPYHALTNGGHISYIELDGDPQKNLEAFEAVVRCMKESGIGYGAINHPVDRDPVCGYTGIIDDECPCCGRTEADGGPKFERIRRITGYLVGTMDKWNNAKRAEEHDRVKHM